MESFSNFFLKKVPRKSPDAVDGRRGFLQLRVELLESIQEERKDVVDGHVEVISATILQILMQIVYAFMCVGDTGSDIATVFLYAFAHDLWFLVLTVLIVFISNIIIAVINMFYYIHGYAELKKINSRRSFRTPPYIWFCRIICTLLFIGPFFRYLEGAWYLIKLRRHHRGDEHKYYIRNVKVTRETVTILTLVESYTEAAPQLALQLLILLKQGDQPFSRLAIQIFSCCTSWFSCTNALVSQARIHRLVSEQHPKGPLRLIDLFLMFLWRFLMVGPRILALSLLASVTRYYVTLCIVVSHWICSTIYVTSRRFPSKNNAAAELIISIVIAFVLIFTDWNSTNGYRRSPYIVYYVITFAEDVSMGVAWFFLTIGSHTWYHWTALIFIAGGFVIGMLFMVFFYLRCALRPKDFGSCEHGESERRN